MQETLDRATPGRPLRVADIRGGHNVRSRLATVGLRPGVTLEVVVRGPLGGPVVVEIDGARLAIGRGVARQVLVEP